MLPLFDRLFPNILILITVFLAACSQGAKESPFNLSSEDYNREKIEEVNILYSDSAIVKMRIKSPLMYRYVENRKSIEEFPNGLLVEFMDENHRITSWLEADYALRKESDNVILVKENVSFYNKRQEKLETDELIYDSKKGQISTDKFVKITQPIKGDTSTGFGFITDEEFNRFEIKKRYSGTKKFDELQNVLNGN